MIAAFLRNLEMVFPVMMAVAVCLVAVMLLGLLCSYSTMLLYDLFKTRRAAIRGRLDQRLAELEDREAMLRERERELFIARHRLEEMRKGRA